MKQVSITVLLTLLTVAAAERSYSAYHWKRVADQRGYYAEQSAAYLFAGSGVLNKEGKELSRRELFDAVLHRLVQQSPQELSFKK